MAREGGPVKVDLGNVLARNVGRRGGLSKKTFEGLERRAGAVHEELKKRRRAGELPFYDLPYRDVGEILAFTKKTLSGPADTLLVLGIGGSALGARAIEGALAPRFGPVKKGGRAFLDLVVADNVDPDGFSQILERCDPEKTLVNVISKSGTTAETMSQYLVVKNRFEKRLGKAKAAERFVFTTDGQKGVLREIADREGITSFEIPAGVGGRFSILTPVGLLPAALIGVDIKGLLEGAASMDKRCARKGILKNPSYAYAATLCLMAEKKGRNISVMMPYSDRLRLLADWFAQLWAESLGKRRSLSGKVVNAGQTPVAALGVTDQHSQLQLYLEGPHDKVVTFLSVEDFCAEVKIPKTSKNEAVVYLGGRGMGELIKAEERATRLALTLNGRPNLTVTVPRVDAHALGELFYLFEVATLFAGGLLGVDPLDQPAVEEGKIYAYGLLGRKGFEEKSTLVEREEKKRKGLLV